MRVIVKTQLVTAGAIQVQVRERSSKIDKHALGSCRRRDSDSRFTAVGKDSINRWVRPFSYQDWPDQLLPNELKNDNPLGISRLVNGKQTTSII